MKNKNLIYVILAIILIGISIFLYFFITNENVSCDDILVNLSGNTVLTLDSNDELSYIFNIDCTNTSNSNVYYNVTLDSNDKIDINLLNIYLVDTTNGNVLLKKKYSELNNKVIYSSKVVGGELTYHKEYKIKLKYDGEITNSISFNLNINKETSN